MHTSLKANIQVIPVKWCYGTGDELRRGSYGGRCRRGLSVQRGGQYGGVLSSGAHRGVFNGRSSRDVSLRAKERMQPVAFTEAQLFELNAEEIS